MLSLLESLQRTKGADVVSAHWPIRLVSTRIAIPQQSRSNPSIFQSLPKWVLLVASLFTFSERLKFRSSRYQMLLEDALSKSFASQTLPSACAH